MSGNGDIKLGITLTGDASGLVGEVKVSKKSLDGLAEGGKKAGDSLASGMDKATKATLTWNQFTSQRMASYMKELGGHAPAIKKISEEWKAYKASGINAMDGVTSASKRLSAAQFNLSRKASAYKSLQIRSNKEIQREIIKTQAAYKRLATSGSTSASELSRAYKITQQRVAGLRREISGVTASGRGVSTLTGKVYGLASAWLGVQGAMKVIGASDTFTSVNARLLNATKNTEEYGIAQREVAAIARETRSSWGGTVDLYSRLSRATQDLDVKQSDLLLVTKSLNQAAIVSGATTIEQSNAMIQLGQGLASGTLRGDELRSVLEQVPRVARLISDGMGIAFGDLRKTAEQGKITTEEIVKAIVKESSTVQTEFNRMPPTISQALGQISNEFTKLIGTQATASGGANDLATSLLAVADGVKDIPQYLPEIEFGLAAVATQFVVGKVAANGFATSVVTAKIAVAGLLKTMIPLASAFAVFEAGKTAIEAYEAGQDAAAARLRNVNQAVDIFGRILIPARKELAKIGIDLNNIHAQNIEEVTAALHKLNAERNKNNPRKAANDEPAAAPTTKIITPLDPKLVAKSLRQANTLTARLGAAFDDTFTKTSTKYVETWQQLVQTHGAGSAQVKQLETAYQAWLNTSWNKQDAKQAERNQKKAEQEQQRVNNVIGLQQAKYLRLNQSAAEAVASDDERALLRLDNDLQTMDAERQRLVDQHIWTEELETQYDQARIDRAQLTAMQLGEIDDRHARKKAASLTESSKFSLAVQKGEISGILGGAAKMTAGLAQHNKAAFKANQMFAKGQVVVDGIVAVQKAASAFPFPANVPGVLFETLSAAGRYAAVSSASFGGGGSIPSSQGGSAGGVPSAQMASVSAFNPVIQRPTTPISAQQTISPSIQITQHITAPNAQIGAADAILAASDIVAQQAVSAIGQDFANDGPLRQTLGV